VIKIEKMTTGKLAKKAGVNVETVRYYEREKLIPEPPRNSSGYRQYSSKDLKRLKFIKSAQKLGFSLKEISELLSLKANSKSACHEVRIMAEEKITLIEDKIKDLEQMKNILVDLTDDCIKAKDSDNCPIIDIINKNPQKSSITY
jgi:MerR family mercuric resistance operon transcriptional regulator